MATDGGTVLDGYAAIYQDVATELTRVLPAGWRNAWVQVELDVDNGSIACFSVLETAPKPVHVKLPVRVFDLFARMQQIARDADAKLVWTTATFMLRSDGSFNIDFGYEPIPIEQQLERRLTWKKRYGLV